MKKGHGKKDHGKNAEIEAQKRPRKRGQKRGRKGQTIFDVKLLFLLSLKLIVRNNIPLNKTSDIASISVSCGRSLMSIKTDNNAKWAINRQIN